MVLEAVSCAPLRRVSQGEAWTEGGARYCQGRFVRCGETRIHEPVRGLKRRWEMSSRIRSSDMGGSFDGTDSIAGTSTAHKYGLT